MEKQILKAVEQAYRQGLKDAKNVNDIRPFLVTSQIVAHQIVNKFYKAKVSVELCQCTGVMDIEKVNGVVWCNTCRKKFI